MSVAYCDWASCDGSSSRHCLASICEPCRRLVCSIIMPHQTLSLLCLHPFSVRLFCDSVFGLLRGDFGTRFSPEFGREKKRTKWN